MKEEITQAEVQKSSIISHLLSLVKSISRKPYHNNSSQRLTHAINTFASLPQAGRLGNLQASYGREVKILLNTVHF